MIHLAGGCREISGVEGLGGSWETEREMVPVGKKEMSWGLTARRAGGGGNQRVSGNGGVVRNLSESCADYDRRWPGWCWTSKGMGTRKS